MLCLLIRLESCDSRKAAGLLDNEFYILHSRLFKAADALRADDGAGKYLFPLAVYLTVEREFFYLLTSDGQPTVTSNAAFPQFMACDGHKVLVPAGALPEADTRPSIIRLGENTYKLIKELIESNKK